LDLKNEDATITHTASTGTPTLTISSTNGPVSVVSDAQYVDIESVRFTGDKIGLDGDTAIMQLTTAGSVGNVAIDGTVTMIDDATSLTHTGATSLAISSTNGHITIAGGSNDYVDIESVRFTNDYIGISTDTDIIQLTSTGSQATVAIVADVDVTGTMDVSSDFEIGTDKFKVVEQTGAVSMISDAQTITHDGATSLTISSSQAAAFVKIQGGSAAYVQVESVKITDNQIGTVSDANLITLEDDKMSLDGALDLKNEDATITHTASSGTPTLTISSTNGPVSVVSNAQYVDVESVRFTGDKIGLDGDTAIMQLTTAGSIGKVTIDGTVEMIDDTTSLTHTGTTSLAISSTNGHVTIAGGADDYVDVESVRFTDAAIGTTGDADLVTLEDNKVTIKGTLTTTDDILMSEETAALTHDSDTGVGLAITSTNGYVDVEQVRFTDDQIGLAGTEGLVTLSSSGVDIAGSLDTDGHFKVADTKFTIDVSGNTYADGTLGVKGLSTLQNNLELSKTDAAIKHTGTGATTGLTISSDNGYVDVESVRFTDATIGTTDDPGLISLTDTDVTVTGTLTVSDNVKLTEDNAVIEHTSTASGASLTIKSNSGYVDVESVRFTGDQIGLDSDTAIMQLTTDGSVGNVAVDGTVTMIDDVTSLTHTGATSLTISSSQAAAFVKIQGGSAAYVQVESVKITDNQIGTVNDANLITLEDDKMSLDGALDLKNEDATITHTASTGTPTLTISSTSGPVSVVSTAQYVEVESVRFTGDQIGLDGDTAIIQLTTANSVGNVAVDGTVTMIDDVTSLTHTGATSLTISSSQAAAFVKIQGGSAAYVQVESVKITDNQIGTVSDANLITLEDDKMSLDGALDLKNEDATITHTASTGTPTLTISSTNGPVSVVSNAQYVEVESVRFTGDQIGLDSDTAIMQLTTDGSVGNVAIDGTVTMIDDVTSLTHTGATSLAISSTNGHITIAGGSNDYVDVESVRFTGDQIGLDGDTAIMQLTTANSVGNVAIDGTVTMIDDVTSLTHTGTTSLAISSTNGHITIAGGSDDYVDVESVRFTNDYIGISTDTDIIQLTSTGSQATVAIVADVDVTGTMDVSSNFEIGTNKFKVVEQTGAVSMISDAQTITHDGATSLTISSSQAAAFVKIEGGSAAYVQVESVKITDNQIGTCERCKPDHAGG
jgi:acyl CoA:acetate/3-ketoacid CoA transferase alpha subunit